MPYPELEMRLRVEIRESKDEFVWYEMERHGVNKELATENVDLFEPLTDDENASWEVWYLSWLERALELIRKS